MRENYVAGRAWWNEGAPEMDRVRRRCGAKAPYGAIRRAALLSHCEVAERARRRSGASSTSTEAGSSSGTWTPTTASAASWPKRRRRAGRGRGLPAVSRKRSSPPPCERRRRWPRYLHESGAQAWGIDGDRLAFAGDSGGAHLGLAATHVSARGDGRQPTYVKCLLLYYGWFGLTDSSSMRLLGGPWDGLSRGGLAVLPANLYAEDPAALAGKPLREPVFERSDA